MFVFCFCCVGVWLLAMPVGELALTRGTWCSGITSASHAEGPGFKSQCVQVAVIVYFPLWHSEAIMWLGWLARRARSCHRQKTKVAQKTFRLFWISFLFCSVLAGSVPGCSAAAWVACPQGKELPQAKNESGPKTFRQFGTSLCLCFVSAVSASGCSPSPWGS